ncbi:YhgE/Pip domain-containing protein [Lactobacillus mulieris]|uniref:ABC-2 type transporter transmembrane domain-containing protein n=1 Tax=Lactobacillus mulieris TaxID=2508708 RepID=A0AAW5X0R0_9LACO|nr:ABC transporter permease [Lactobacillus mulieris]MCZ3622853.1 hypothetical protein [Lactobacillus mulieris]MCZ3624533.1 hypothetical protein [Lactobacillus mulieris]MCZ3636858.1 hypothetical protein [Lactobacillus mulieris]MCZ3690786.1 hypothetical protein [Lactobacillus mulieris]MCZ3696756.1 hypothetical protein [Lactobacillus mulieris]
MQIRKFFKSKGVIIAALAVIIYSLAVFGIYFNGYKPMPDKVKDLPITIVNQDAKASTIEKNLKENLPFKTIHLSSDLSKSKKDLKNNKVYMVIEIPKNFTQKISENKSTQLNFYINEANQYPVVNGMKNIASQISSSINRNVIVKKTQVMLTKQAMAQMQKELATIAAQSPAQAKVAQKAANEKVANMVNENTNKLADSVQTQIYRINPVKNGMNYAMAPFFLNMAGYIGALFGTILLYGTYAKFAKSIGRFKAYANLELAFAVMAFLGSLAMTFAAVWIGKYQGHLFAQLIFTHWLVLMGAYNLNAILVLLLGQMGTAINTLFTMIQVIAGGGMIPLQVASPFFNFWHYISPIYYGTLTDFKLLAETTTNIGQYWLGAVWLIVGLVIANLIIVSLRKTQPMTNFESLA